MSSASAVRRRKSRWLAFRLGEADYAIPLDRVESVLSSRGLAVDAGAPPEICGVLERSGSPLPVIDVRRRLELEEPPKDLEGRVIAVSAAGRSFGLLVDRVERPLALLASTVQRLPPLAVGIGAEHLVGVAARGEGWLILLNVDRLVRAPVTSQEPAPAVDGSV